MKKNLQINRWMHASLLLVASFALLSCGGYYYADGVYYDPVPERPSYLEIVEEPAYTPVENRYTPNRYKDYFSEKAQQYRQMPDTSVTHFTDVNSYRSNATSGAPAYGGWGSNPSQVNVNVYNNNPWGYNSWSYNNWYPNYYGYDSYYRNRARWSLSFGWGWGSYYDPYWGYSGYYGYRPYYGGYYDYYPYYGYSPYYGYGYSPYYGYYPYGGYYPYYGYYYDYRPRDYYYEPSRSYGNGGSYSGRGRAIIRDDNYRSNANRYEDGRGSYSRSQSQGYYNNNGNYSGRPSYQNQQYNNNPPTGYETRRAYESNSNYSGRSSNYSNSSSSGGNYSSGSSNSSSSSSGGYRSSNRD